MIPNMSEAERREEEERNDEMLNAPDESEDTRMEETEELDELKDDEDDNSLELGMNESDRMDGDDILDDLLPTKDENNFEEDEEDVEQRDDISDEEEEEEKSDEERDEMDGIQENAVSDIRQSLFYRVFRKYYQSFPGSLFKASINSDIFKISSDIGVQKKIHEISKIMAGYEIFINARNDGKLSDTEDDLVQGDGVKFPDSDFSEVSKRESEDETDGGKKSELGDKEVSVISFTSSRYSLNLP